MSAETNASAPSEGVEGLEARLRRNLTAPRSAEFHDGTLLRDAVDLLDTLTSRVRALEAGTGYAVAEATRSLRASNTRLEDENATLTSRVRDLEGEVKLDDAAHEQAKRIVGGWIDAVMAHYPMSWAFDPTSPRLMVDNVVRSLTDKHAAEVARLTEARAAGERETLEVEQEARRLYIEYTDNHPTIHSNRFPAWRELSAADKAEWLRRAALSARRPTETGGET